MIGFYHMRRITRKRLQTLLDQLNELVGNQYHLDYAACYGGYTLTYNNDSSHLIGRIPPKEMLAYLLGALDFVSQPR